MSDSASPFHLFGIRHHGPGCARSLRRALDALQPDCLLIEGPPDGEAMLSLVTHPQLVPPVALLVFDPENARDSAFYPFAEFSPEWQALRYGLTQGIPTRFIDLPIAHQLALNTGIDNAAPQNDGESDTDPIRFSDPLDWLARAAGYGDGETWWNHLVEERNDGLELFAAIREAMRTVRTEAPARLQSDAETRREALREAHMRKCLRQAQKEGLQRIAVVCGAWHLPALEDMPAIKADNELLKGLPKRKVAATWVPWTHAHLASASGYGAGVTAPGWYEYLWHHGDSPRRAIGWLARAARLFRESDLDCSSAHLIEASRLADTLAALRERPQPGLPELEEALRTVVCMGDDAPLHLIETALIVGHRMGRIPPEAPAVPLQQDIARTQKTLRLKPEALQKTLDLDLREANDLARSHFFHRLQLLDIDWASPTRGAYGAKGSFHEIWSLQWAPSHALSVIEAARWGNTVASAASHKATHAAKTAQSLPEISALVRNVLLADLAEAIAPVAHALENLAAVGGDVPQLLGAIPPLAAIVRYGNVRQTDAGMVERALDSLVPRAAIGLPSACLALDDDAAQSLRKTLLDTHQAIRLLDHADYRTAWLDALRRTGTANGAHGLLGGLAARLLFDERAEAPEDTARQVSLALSTGNDPAPAAAWLEGFLNQSSMILLHDARLWTLVNDWLAALTDTHFERILPLLRRTFSTFSAPERRQLGERARRPAGTATPPAAEWDSTRADLAVPLLRKLLGLPE